jgi:23S rRNA pseudouridine2457 synthase
MLIAFNKPYGVLSQFTPNANHRTLTDYEFPRHVYPIGRLDADSEGLLLLSDEPALNRELLHPSRRHQRCYWAQVERVPSLASLKELEKGVMLQGRKTLPCRAALIVSEPLVPQRDPPIRFRKSVETVWLQVEIIEGRNRQVRRMTAAIGHPTLRLIRVKIGRFDLGNLPAGTWKLVSPEERRLVFAR